MGDPDRQFLLPVVTCASGRTFSLPIHSLLTAASHTGRGPRFSTAQGKHDKHVDSSCILWNHYSSTFTPHYLHLELVPYRVASGKGTSSNNDSDIYDDRSVMALVDTRDGINELIITSRV